MNTFKQYFTESLWKNINAKKKRGGKSARKGSKAYKAAKKAGDKLNKTKHSDEEDAESSPGRVKRAGASCKGSVTELRKRAKKYGGEKGKMYHWCANMKGGRKKKSESEEDTPFTLDDVLESGMEILADYGAYEANLRGSETKDAGVDSLKELVEYYLSKLELTDTDAEYYKKRHETYQAIWDENFRLNKELLSHAFNKDERRDQEILNQRYNAMILSAMNAPQEGEEEDAEKKKKVSKTRAKCQAKAKRKYDVWPSAYASGYVQKCVNRGGNIK